MTRSGKKKDRPFYIFCEMGHEFPETFIQLGGRLACGQCCSPIRCIRLPKGRIDALRSIYRLGGMKALVDEVFGQQVPRVETEEHLARLAAHNHRVGYHG